MGTSSESYMDEVARQLVEYGTKLMDPPDDDFQLFQILQKLEQIIAVVEQGPSEPMQDSLILVLKGLIEDNILKHTNVDIRVSVAYCFAEIMRITAPDAPYNDEDMKELFQIMVEALESLTLLYSPNFVKTVSLLESVARFKSCILMLDLQMDELVIKMVTNFFEKIRSNHPNNLLTAVEKIITIFIEESEDISAEFLSPLLESVRKNSQYLSPQSWKLGEKVFNNCAAKLKPYLVEAVKGVGNDLDNFLDVVANICKSEAFEQNHEKNSQGKTASNSGESNGMLQDNENKLDRKNPEKPSQDEEHKLDRTDPDHPSQYGGNKLNNTLQCGGNKLNKTLQYGGNKLNKTDPSHPSKDGGNKLERTDPDQPSQDHVNKLDRTDPGSPSQVEPAPDDFSLTIAGQAMGNASKLHGRTDASTDDRNPKENGISSKGLDHCDTEHSEGTNAQGNAKTINLKFKMTVKSGAAPDNVPKKRDRKPNSLLRSEEGYDHSWISAGRKDVKSPQRKMSSGKMSNNLEVSGSLIDGSSDKRQHTRSRPNKRESKVGPDARPILSPEMEDALNIVSPSDPSSFGGHKKRRPKKPRTRSKKTPADDIIKSSSTENSLNGGVKEETLQSGSAGKNKEIGYASCFTAKLQSHARDVVVGQAEHGAALTLGYAENIGEEKAKMKRHVIRSDNDRNETSGIKKVILKTIVSPQTGLKEKCSVPEDKKIVLKTIVSPQTGLKEKCSVPEDKKVVSRTMVSPQTGLKEKRSVPEDKVPDMGDLDGRLVGRRIKVWWPLDKTYYEGVIESFDPIKKKHKVFYTDGDIENLNLYNQRWEWIQDDDQQDEEEAEIQIIGSSSARVPKRKRKSKLAKVVGSSSKRLEAPIENKGDESTDSEETLPLVAKPDRPRIYDSDTETSSDTNIQDYVVKPTAKSKMEPMMNSDESTSETETDSEAGSPKGGMTSCSARRPIPRSLFIRD